MCLSTPRHQLGDSYNVQLPIQGVTVEDTFAEAASLIRDEFVGITLNPFTVTWLQPELLPSYAPATVKEMKVQGQGYLYFALGADNQTKNGTQQVNPIRLTNFYAMSNADILAELARLISARTCTTNINQLSVQWLNKSAPAAREFNSVSEVVAQLRREIAESAARIQAGEITADHTHTVNQIEQLTEGLNDLAAEINERQLKGNYVVATDPRLTDIRSPKAHTHVVGEVAGLGTAATHNAEDFVWGDDPRFEWLESLQQQLELKEDKTAITQVLNNYASIVALNNAIASVQEALNQKQAAGNYATAQGLIDAIALLQTEIDKRQLKGNYALVSALNDAIAFLQGEIDKKQEAGNYVLANDPKLTDARQPLAHNQAISTITGLQTALDAKQNTGNYATQLELAAYQPAGNYQAAGDYALNSNFTLEASTTATLLNGWTRYNLTYGSPAYYKNPFGEVVLVGLMKGGTLNTAALTLPDGYRPRATKIFQVFSSNNTGTMSLAYVEVRTDGSVVPVTGNNLCFSIEGIRFRTT